jgi:hypothetical protein
VVECAGLENQSPCKRTAGSNPAPSAGMSRRCWRFAAAGEPCDYRSKPQEGAVNRAALAH